MYTQLLQVRNLVVYYATRHGVVKAVDGMSFHVGKGEKVCLIGESGSGKSTVALSIMKLLPKNATVEGEIIFEGINLLNLSEDDMRKIRGSEISMVFQDPLTALNPLLTIGLQCSEPYEEHLKISRREAMTKAIDMLKKVKIPSAEIAIRRYPHTFSGGMRQRSLIAMMLSLKPKLIVADEPFSALDVSLQVGVMQLLNELIKDSGASLLLITHDLGVAAEMCDRVVVMYAGKLLEESDVFNIFDNPKHPYTQGLLSSLPTPDKILKKSELPMMRGLPPSLVNPPPGCRFHPRCPFATEKCSREEPPLVEIDRGHKVACWLQKGV
ncbi:MAG: ABC transporter ATP-binding protein [Desulfurococcaceae archaeon]